MAFKPADDPAPIFQDGRLRPGVYKIQNLKSETYLDVIQHSKELCCRPARDLEDGKGLIKSFGVGYTVRRIDPGMPEQFCTPMEGISNGTPLYANAYPVAWRVVIVDNELYRGFEYVRFYWGPSRRTWDLWGGGPKENGAKTLIQDDAGVTWQMWRLIPVALEA